MAMPQPDDGLEGLAPVKMRPPAGIMPNAQHQTFHGFMTGAPYELAIVEFDDQGRCYDRGQMDGVAKRLEALAPEHGSSAEDVILIIFVHGWKHDARSDDDNLTAFRVLLKETAEYEKGAASPGVRPRPVLGVFVGWRGLSDFRLGDTVADATFWGRQAAGQRVATGSVRELLGRARLYRNRRRKHGGNPLLLIVGHSFGGMIVYSAPGAVAHPGGLRTGRQCYARIRRSGAVGEPGDRGRAFPSNLRSGDRRCVQGPHDETASRLHLRAGRE
jgi:hypothetical protein